MNTQTKNRTNIYYGLIFILILSAIVVVAILGQVQNKASKSDVRARASANSGVIVEGTIWSVDEVNEIMIAENIYFPVDDPSKVKSMGIWTITLPPGFNASVLYAGVKVRVMLNPATFIITERTATAVKIEVIK